MAALQEILKSNIARGVSDEVVERIVSMVEYREYMGGDTIVRQFERQNDLLIVLEGNVRITAFSGEEIGTMGPNSVIGEVAFIDSKPRSATIRSVGPTKLAIIPGGPLHALIRDDHRAGATILYNICQILCDRLRLANLE